MPLSHPLISHVIPPRQPFITCPPISHTYPILRTGSSVRQECPYLQVDKLSTNRTLSKAKQTVDRPFSPKNQTSLFALPNRTESVFPCVVDIRGPPARIRGFLLVQLLSIYLHKPTVAFVGQDIPDHGQQQVVHVGTCSGFFKFLFIGQIVLRSINS